jgi:hypothetical protein
MYNALAELHTDLYIVLAEILREKIPHGIYRQKWEDTIKIDPGKLNLPKLDLTVHDTGMVKWNVCEACDRLDLRFLGCGKCLCETSRQPEYLHFPYTPL